MSLKVALGGHVKDVGSSKNTKTGGWRTFKPVIDNERCVDCGTCWTFCPEPCITREDGKYIVDFDYCKGCGICAYECPVKAIEMILEEK